MAIDDFYCTMRILLMCIETYHFGGQNCVKCMRNSGINKNKTNFILSNKKCFLAQKIS